MAHTTGVLGFLLAAVMAAPAAAQVEVVDLEGQRTKGKLLALDALNGTLTLRIKNRDKVLVLGKLVEIVNRSRGLPARVGIEMEYPTGELVRGTLGKPRAMSIKITSALGVFEADIENDAVTPRWIRMIGGDVKPPLDAASLDASFDAIFGRDGVLIAQGDITAFAGDKVRMEDAHQNRVERSWTEIGAIRFAAEGDTPPPPAGLRAIVEGVDGSVVIGRLKGLNAGLVKIISATGKQLNVPLTGIGKISLSGGQFDYLSDLTPTRIREIPHLFDPKVDHTPPFRGKVRNYFVDRAYPGTAPLRLGQSTHRKGLGLHSWVSVTYALDGKYRRFTAQVGIDDGVRDLPGDVSERGSVIFRVLVDGRPKAKYPQQGFLAGGAEPVDVKLDIKGATTLTLIVDYAGNPGPPDYADTHIRDRVALVSPRLIK